MSELTGNLLWIVVGTVALLFVLFTFFPKRTRKTVNYLLLTWAEFKQVKKGDPAEKIEVPDFETKKMERVPDPRTSGEKKK